ERGNETMRRSKTKSGRPVDPFWKTGCWHECYTCRHKFHCVGDPLHRCRSGPGGRNVCPSCGSTGIRTDDIRHTPQWKYHPQVQEARERATEAALPARAVDAEALAAEGCDKPVATQTAASPEAGGTRKGNVRS